ncbi:hypothetical protein ACIRRI_50740, partial [Streptomyces mirabilis]|uniref:hypothetical protein n=1 Tax=Streptomyces mirabilis TaxID=68239 RepID=UPI003808F071
VVLEKPHHRSSQGTSSFPEELSTGVSRWIRAEAYGLDETHMTYFRLAVRYLVKADEPYNAGAPMHRMTREHIEESMARVRCVAPSVLATIRPLVEYMAESHNKTAGD